MRRGEFASALSPVTGDTDDRARMKNPRHRGGFVCASGSGRLVPGFVDRASPDRHPVARPVRVADSAGLVSAARPGRLVAGRPDRVAIADHLGFDYSRTSPFMRARMGATPQSIGRSVVRAGSRLPDRRDKIYVKRCRTASMSKDVEQLAAPPTDGSPLICNARLRPAKKKRRPV
jgi:hypothetical protein